MDLAPGAPGTATATERGVVKLTAEEVQKQAFFNIAIRTFPGRSEAAVGASAPRGLQTGQSVGAR
jgi:hypothetical protein